MIRVLQVLGDTDDGDLPRFALDLHDRLTASGADVRTVALGPGRRGGLDAVVPVLSPSRRSLAAHSQLRREQRWADVVVLRGEVPVAVAGTTRVAGGPPWVVAFGDEPRRWSTAAVPGRVRRALERTTTVVVTDDEAARALAGTAAGPAAVEVVPVGVSAAPPPSDAARRVARSELGLEATGAVARWVGEPGSDEDGSALAGRAAAAAGIPLLGTEPRDRTGVRAELVEAAADLAVLPTARRCGPPRGLLLAARAGHALVAPDGGALAGLVDPGTGVPASTPDAVVEAVAALAADGAARARAGAEAVTRVASSYDLDDVAAAWSDLLTSVAGS